MTKLEREIVIKEQEIKALKRFITEEATADQIDEVEKKEKELTLAEKALKILQSELDAEADDPKPKESDDAAKTVEDVVEDTKKTIEAKNPKVVEKSTKYDVEVTPEIKKFFDFTKGIVSKALGDEQTTATGGNNQKETIMPSVFAKKIVEQATSGSSILSLITVVSFDKWEEELGGNPFVYRRVSEGADVNNKNDAETVTFKLSNDKYAAGATLTKEVLKFSTVEFIDYFIGRFAKGFETMLKKEIIDGSIATTGIHGLESALTQRDGVNEDINVIATSTLAKKDTIQPDDLEELILQLEDSDEDGAALLMHKSTWSAIRNMKDKNDAFLYGDRDISTKKGSRKFRDFPVYFSSHMPKLKTSTPTKPVIYFGDFSEYILNARQGFTLEFSDHAEFVTDKRVYKSIAYLGGKVRRGEAFHALVNRAARKK